MLNFRTLLLHRQRRDFKKEEQIKIVQYFINWLEKYRDGEDERVTLESVDARTRSIVIFSQTAFLTFASNVARWLI